MDCTRSSIDSCFCRCKFNLNTGSSYLSKTTWYDVWQFSAYYLKRYRPRCSELVAARRPFILHFQSFFGHFCLEIEIYLPFFLLLLIQQWFFAFALQLRAFLHEWNITHYGFHFGGPANWKFSKIREMVNWPSCWHFSFDKNS